MYKNSTTYYLPLNISLIVTTMKGTQGLRFSQQAKRQHKPSPAASGPAGDTQSKSRLPPTQTVWPQCSRHLINDCRGVCPLACYPDWSRNRS